MEAAKRGYGVRVVYDLSPTLFMPAGITTYTAQLYRSLQSLSAEDGIQLTASQLPAWLHPNGTYGLRHKLKVMTWDSYYMHFLLPYRASTIAADLIHTPAFRLPFRSKTPIVTTILDVILFVYPHLFRLRERLTIGLYLRASSHCVEHVITISKQSRQDIQRYLGIDSARITVTYPAAASYFRPVSERDTTPVLARYGIMSPYILSVGTLEPRKNLVRVLEAFATLHQRHAIPHQLVLVGRRGWLEDPIFATVRKLGIEKHVHFTGYVAEADLPALYSGASVFVYPSLYEGFGIPPLEAMACGCPVVTSNCSALPEVVGDAAFQVDPKDVVQIADAIERVLTDAALAQQMCRKGLSRAEQFSWRRCAEETVAAYRHVVSGC